MLCIVYATQGGTAEEYAQRVARAARIRGVEYRYTNVTDLTMEELLGWASSGFTIAFLISTTGEGEMPKAMLPLWRTLLRRDLRADCLMGSSWAIFGLGDSSYEHFCWAAKKLHRRVEQLGAGIALERGDGDEQHALGLDSAFIPWMRRLWQFLGVNQSINHGGREEDEDESVGPPSVQLAPEPSSLSPMQGVSHQAMSAGVLSPPPSSSMVLPYQATVLQNRRITAVEHFQDVRHIELQLGEEDISGDLNEKMVVGLTCGISRPSPRRPCLWRPGDVAILLPSNDPQAVTELLEKLGWASCADVPFRVRGLNAPELTTFMPINSIITLRDLLTHSLDIWRPPSRAVLALLADHVDRARPDGGSLHWDKLRELASPAGLDLYLTYIGRPRRRLVEVLEDFGPSLHLPMDPSHVFDLFPRLRPREYSISSNSNGRDGGGHPAPVLSVTAALVHYSTGLPTPREGVCSHWLRSLRPGSGIRLGIRRGDWRLPQDQDAAAPSSGSPDGHALPVLVMMAAGTGIAPMRALIHHQWEQFRGLSPPMYLYFGCRYLERDWLYEQEWAQVPTLTVRALGSRDQPGARRHLPVLLREHREELRGLLANPRALFYLAGNSRLPRIVKATLGEIAEDPGLPERLLQASRLHIESWS